MPVGVPKIPFRIPGDNCLYRLRFLFLCQEVDYEVTSRITGLMVYLSIEDRTKDLYLFIHSPGGLILPGMAIYDLMHVLGPEVNTVGMGLVASMGSIILTGGTFTKRFAYPHARVMMHQPASSYWHGAFVDSDMESDTLDDLRNMVTWIYVERTGNPFEVVKKDLERDEFMSATQALDHGIVDFIAE
uniref:clp protease proteolytic subunit n=1 Tax=Triphyophyllum peltatum TaxID=63090 RepID=UPI0022A6D50B|nr:clp protease proteolytic subunit [Triphyophyllum peltatum]UZT27832.1 clp protease proteolytic subunit [Triphyophyllum peltatum]